MARPHRKRLEATDRAGTRCNGRAEFTRRTARVTWSVRALTRSLLSSILPPMTATCWTAAGTDPFAAASQGRFGLVGSWR